MDEDTYGLVEHDGELPDTNDTGSAADTTLSHDLPCRHCGYNLRGMTEDRACPECGTAVGRSLLGDQLRFADPEWVDTLAKGSNWILWSVLVNLILGAVGMGLGIAVGATGGNVVQMQEALVFLSALPAIIYLVGVWLLTTPEPGIFEESGMPLRSLLRWTALFGGLVGILNIGFQQQGVSIGSVVIGIVGGIVGLIGYIALFVFARRLALRVPDYDLAKQTHTVMWGIILSMGGVIVFGILAAIVGSASGGAGAIVLAIPVCVLAVAYLVFAIWSLVLLFKYRRVSQQAARQARSTWARAIT